MCGINGFSWEDKNLIKQMNKIISYRGPDDKGTYTDKHVSLGHNRLSIIDLSKAGKQPMTNEDGSIFIVFNGEIYNFKEIKQKLIKKGHKFNSNTDTEVIIHAYEEFGEECLKLFNGMFAFAIWDTNNKKLFLARDRLGIKPLYYYLDQKNEKLIFSSEIKGILQHEIKKKINIQSFNSFLTYRFITSDETMIQNIKKLKPGHYLTYQNKKIHMNKYWNLKWNTINKSKDYFVKKIDQLLNESVDKRLLSDVPLGIFLSGGLDSSLITSINSKLRNDTIKTFSIGFNHKSDELKYASKVANLLNTNHKELILDYNQITKEIPNIVWYMDEPHSDPSVIPLYFLSKFAKKDITVVNTGEGADELFSGYYHYYIGSNLFNTIPNLIKKKVYNYYYSPFKKNQRKQLLNNSDNTNNNINSSIKEDNTLKRYLNKKHHILNNVLHFDIKKELPNWQLTRVDRLTMAHGMEARVPFLDHNLVELSSSIPTNLKQKGFCGKYILKKVAKKYLPKEIIYRKKQGFTTPLHLWFKHDFNNITQNLFNDTNINFINKNYIKKLLNKQKNIKNHTKFTKSTYQLFILSLFTIWHKTYIDQNKPKLINNLI
jgi:asparagine synthase (glutamine-hydrolysing)